MQGPFSIFIVTEQVLLNPERGIWLLQEVRHYLSGHKGVCLLRNDIIRGVVLKNPSRDQSPQVLHPGAREGERSLAGPAS